jgi:hypothetical protein
VLLPPDRQRPSCQIRCVLFKKAASSMPFITHL